MQKTIVLINGEAQSGKSTLANHAANLLMENGIQAATYSFVAPYRPMLESLFTYITGEPVDTVGDYEDLKRMRIVPGLPFTGRDWMIQIGNASRALHPYFLPALFMEFQKTRPEVDVWFIENWGFQDEYEFFVSEPQMRNDFRIVTVSLTQRGTRHYKSGEQYDRDNRYNLDSLAMLVDPKVNRLCAEIDEDHDYPIDSIAEQFGTPLEADIHEGPEPASELAPESQPSVGVESEEKPHTAADMEAAWAKNT